MRTFESPDSDSKTRQILHYSNVPSVFAVELPNKIDCLKMFVMTAVGKIQPDYIQTGREHFAQDSVVVAGRA
jgi:non-ribosomal peptide synthetase component E (peptide arylation enzyme)